MKLHFISARIHTVDGWNWLYVSFLIIFLCVILYCWEKKIYTYPYTWQIHNRLCQTNKKKNKPANEQTTKKANATRITRQKNNTNQTKQNIRHTKTGQNTRTLYTCLYTCISLLTYALTLGIIKLLCNTFGPVAFQCIIPTPTPRRWKDVMVHHWLLLHLLLHNLWKTYTYNCYMSTNSKRTPNCFLHSFSRNKNCYFPPHLTTPIMSYIQLCAPNCAYLL